MSMSVRPCLFVYPSVRLTVCSSRCPDNSHLPVGGKVAILITGLTRSLTPALMLPTLTEHVIQGLGEEHVHVFVHTCGRPLGDSADKSAQAKEREAIADMYKELVPVSVLRAVVVTSPDYGRTPQTIHLSNRYSAPINSTDEAGSDSDGTGIPGVPRFWEHPFETYPLVFLLQFESLVDIFRLLLREEIRQQERYSHVVRMRTDAMWSVRWAPYSQLRSLLPPASDKLAAVPTQGEGDKRAMQKDPMALEERPNNMLLT